MIDTDGYRPNVGIILCNDDGKVLWCRRIGQNSWQFPQGGIKAHETPESAMYRELEEEIGLKPEHVIMLGNTQGWLQYKLPSYLIRKKSLPLCIGQKQVWFLLRLNETHKHELCFDKTDTPEFDSGEWVDYWYPIKKIIKFKRKVYQQALEELHPLLAQR